MKWWKDGSMRFLKTVHSGKKWAIVFMDILMKQILVKSSKKYSKIVGGVISVVGIINGIVGGVPN
jgi:hypothetical protein